MATLAPQITATGISAPDFENIRQQLRIQYWGIYGADANLDPDSQDGQWIDVLAAALNECNQAVIAAYNAFSPATAQGAGLSSVVKINGLKRGVPSNSQAVVTISGVAGTVITGGTVGDSLSLGTVWTLPAVVTISDTGTVDVTATCTKEGSVPAVPGSLTEILTPTLGWQSVTNAAAASPGNAIETDAALRARQEISTAGPSTAIIDGITAAISSINGVGRLKVYENDSDVTDGNGVKSHSIAAIVSGGDADAIASAIALRKPPGTGTAGTVVKVVPDSRGMPRTIRFYELATVPISLHITIKNVGGYISTTGDTLKASVAAFINSLDIGEDVYLTRNFSPANLGGVGEGATFVVTQILQARDAGVQAAADIVIAFNEAAICRVDDIVLTVIP